MIARRPVARAVAWLAAAVLAAGCSLVPTSGPIVAGPVVDFAESAQFIRVVAAPPSPGATPAEVVRGFIEASADLAEDRAIARRYLTAEAAATWDAGASTTVFEQGSLAVTATGATVRVAAQVTGRVHGDGTLDVVSPAEALILTLDVTRVVEPGATRAEWRIADPPAGVLLSDVDLRRAYRRHGVHFPSARSPALVPDARLIPVVGPSLPTTLAEQVLAGPSDWLAPAVRTGVPRGTALAVGAVPVAEGVALVELTEQALLADPEQRADLAAQLTWTLTQLPEVQAVEIRVRGAALDVAGAGPRMDRRTWQDRAPDVLTLGPGGEGPPAHYLLDAASIVRVAGERREVLADVPGARRASALAVSLDARQAAVVVDGGARMWLVGLEPPAGGRRAVAGTGITSVSYDVDGWAWYADDGGLRRVASDGRVRDVRVVGDLDARGITAVSLARDGARAVVVAGGEVLLGAVVRARGTVQLASLRRVDPATTDVRGVAWRDSATLDVLGTLPGTARQVLRVEVGSGQVVPAGAPPLPLDVAAAPAGPTLVRSGQGPAFANVGLQWRELGPARAVAYPG